MGIVKLIYLTSKKIWVKSSLSKRNKICSTLQDVIKVMDNFPYSSVYDVYNRVPSSLNKVKRRSFKRALRKKYPLAKAYQHFEDYSMYEAYRIHLSYRPTLKRLASLAWLRQQAEIKKCSLADLTREVPQTLLKEVKTFQSNLWSLVYYDCFKVACEFVPPLENDEELIGKRFLLTSTKDSDNKMIYKSVAHGWERIMKWDNALLNTKSTDPYIIKCIEALCAEENVGKIIMTILENYEKEYLVQFEYTEEQPDFSDGGFVG